MDASTTSKPTKANENANLEKLRNFKISKLHSQTNSVLRDEKQAENARRRQQWQNS
jgi:hypothetical protein